MAKKQEIRFFIISFKAEEIVYFCKNEAADSVLLSSKKFCFRTQFPEALISETKVLSRKEFEVTFFQNPSIKLRWERLIFNLTFQKN